MGHDLRFAVCCTLDSAANEPPKTRVILSGVPSGAKAGRNAVEEPVLSLPKESRRFRATSPVNSRDPSTPLRLAHGPATTCPGRRHLGPPFRLRSAQDDTRCGEVHCRRQQNQFCEGPKTTTRSATVRVRDAAPRAPLTFRQSSLRVRQFAANQRRPGPKHKPLLPSLEMLPVTIPYPEDHTRRITPGE